ncbi:MAG: Gfo/Idh/MocA family oxidoreductase [Pirellulaceae bacterium]|nr:Gfo/Idh/MocA family oxidoreductase [Planctomycetales bacterium]
MIRVGVVGLGMMGLTHLDIYHRNKRSEIAAICDSDPARLHGEAKAAGNIEGQATFGVEQLHNVKRYTDPAELFADADIDMVDVCLPTHLHLRFGLEAMRSGKHVMLEKPLARTAADALKLAEGAEQAQGLVLIAHCMRFWPGWSWLRDAIADQRYGKVLSASFRRVATHPGGPFYLDGERSGGAALDLHIHDTDFVQFCFGMPKSVQSSGFAHITSAIDHIVTQYHYDDVPLVMAEGSWSMAAGFTFNMSYTVNFEQATLAYDLGRPEPLQIYREGTAQTMPVDAVMGYDLEIDYFLDCIERGKRPETVTPQDAYRSVKLVEAEVQSVAEGRTVALE